VRVGRGVGRTDGVGGGPVAERGVGVTPSGTGVRTTAGRCVGRGVCGRGVAALPGCAGSYFGSGAGAGAG